MDKVWVPAKCRPDLIGEGERPTIMDSYFSHEYGFALSNKDVSRTAFICKPHSSTATPKFFHGTHVLPCESLLNGDKCATCVFGCFPELVQAEVTKEVRVGEKFQIIPAAKNMLYVLPEWTPNHMSRVGNRKSDVKFVICNMPCTVVTPSEVIKVNDLTSEEKDRKRRLSAYYNPGVLSSDYTGAE